MRMAIVGMASMWPLVFSINHTSFNIFTLETVGVYENFKYVYVFFLLYKRLPMYM